MQATFDQDIAKCIETLRAGGIIIYPTDTVWGIGCDAANEQAVEKIYQIKQRHDNQKMLVLLDNVNRLDAYVDTVPEIAYSLIELSEKPVTVIYTGAKNIAPNLLDSDGSIGIRITNERFTQRLIQQFRRPIVSTSCNIHGQAHAAFFDEINPAIIAAADYVVQYRRDDRTPAQPSSIIKLWPDGQIKIIRP